MDTNTLILNIALFLGIIFTVLSSKRYFHMLQLNSYRNNRLLKWFDANFFAEFKYHDLIIMWSLCFLFSRYSLVFLLLWLCYFVFDFYMVYIKNATPVKKKFVMTARVKRLYFTLTALLLLLLLAASNTSHPRLVVTALAVLYMSKVGLTVLINTINHPIELFISKWYVKDAKKILDAHNPMKIIGITGSYGKTSTKYILNKILSEKYNVLMTPESYNTPMGVIRTIRESLKPQHDIFIVEMGAKQSGDIKEICDLVKPGFGIITAVGLQHLESFGTLENIIDTKFELQRAIPEDGTVFLNYGNQNIRSVNLDKPVITYGINDNTLDYWAEDIIYDNKGLSFTLHWEKERQLRLTTRLLGVHNVLNITGAASIALKFGLSESQIQYAVKQLLPVPHRLELKPNDTGALVIDDAFNSNPEGAMESLNVLSKFDGMKKVLISPGMIELGESEYQCNYDFGLRAAEVCDFIIWVGQNRSKPMVDALEHKKYNKDNVFVAKNLTEALGKMRSIVTKDSVVLFENDLPDNYEG